jgi:hypothetical protein
MIETPRLALAGVRHGFFTRQGGVSEGIYASLNIGFGSSDARDRVAQNRARVASALGATPDRLVMPYQIHSPDCVIVDAPFPAGETARCDALATATPGLAIGVSTADCGPLLFADPDARVVGAAHAGWKGAFTGVIEATLDAMERLGARRSRITAVLGPTISGANYEVGPEFVERFEAQDLDNSRFFHASPKAGHAFFDLPGYIAKRLAAAGVGTADDLGLCTYADEDRFFSYRRATHRGEPDYGRLVSAIMIAG